MVEHWDHLLAWAVYLVCGLVFCLASWRLTRGIRNRALRDLVRGTLVVIIFTPWPISEELISAGQSSVAAETVGVEFSPGSLFFAPAIVILLFDVILLGMAGQLRSGLALLIAEFVLLLWLVVRPRLGEARRHRGSIGRRGSTREAG